GLNSPFSHIKSFYGEGNLRSDGDEERLITRLEIGEDEYPKAIAFMENLPRFFELPEAILVHGYFEPGIPLTEQKEDVLVGSKGVEYDLEEKHGHPWYETYDGSKPIIVGHRNYLCDDAEIFHPNDRVFCIDTTCYSGGNLTGLILPEFRVISVKSSKDYWREKTVQYAHLFVKEQSDEITFDILNELIAIDMTNSDVSPEVAESLPELKVLADKAEKQLDKLYYYVLGQHKEILSSLHSKYNFHNLSKSEQDIIYGTHIRNS
ncbi:unnamed protein product, partial [marine sediment metagenome]